MRGGAQVKEALGFVTLLWNHPVLTGLLLLIFTPPFFPLVVYFSPLLMSTALCVVALVSVGSQMEKIKAEGGPGQQLETHLGRDHGVSTWVPPRDHTRSDQATHHYGESNRHRNLYANIHVVPAPPSWTGGQDNTTTAQLRPVENNDPPTPAAAESDEDWWDTWVKEYESRPGWGEQEDQQPFRTPAAIPTSTTSQAPAPPTIPTKEDAPLKPEIRDENRPGAAPVAAPIPAPAVAAPVAAPVSVSVVMSRQEAASRSLPPPPTTSTSRSLEEVVVSVKVTDFHPHISTLAPIRTGRETARDRQVDRIGKTAQEILAAPTKVEVPAERVSNAQALQSIEKLLHMEIGGSQNVDVKNANSTAPQARSPRLIGAPGKGIAVEASEKNRNKIAADIAGETPLLRHLKTSRSEKHSRNSSAFSPLPQRASRGLMSEKVLPPPQFSPRLLQSLQPLPPKGLSPRPLPNLSTVPLGNPVEKIPQWVYDGIPKERAEKQAMKAETAEEKQVRAFEQAVKVLSYTRRRTHARRPAPIQVDTADLQGFKSSPTTPSVDKSTERSSRRTSPHRPASRASSPPRASPVVVASESLPSRISEDLAAEAAELAHGAGDPHGTSVADSTERALPTPRSSAAPSPSISPSNLSGASTAAAAAASPRMSSFPAAASPPKASIVTAASPPRASRALSPQKAPIAASPGGASSPQTASIATSPRPASSPQKASIPASPRPASSPQKASIAASPRPASSPQQASIAASPRPASSPQQASIAASPRPASSPQKAPIAASPRPASSPQQASIAASPGGASSSQSAAVAASPPPASSPQQASIAASPRGASSPQSASVAASPPPASSPQEASIAASPWGASSPQSASIAAYPRPASSSQQASIPASPRGASSPQKAPIAASPRGASRAPSPQSASTAASSPQKAPIAASPRRASRASSPSIGSSPWPASISSPSPQKPTASPPRRPSVPSSPSMSHPRRRRQHSSKHCTDKVALPSPIRIEGSTYYDTPAVEKEEDSAGEDYVPIEKEVRFLPSVEDKAEANCEEGDATAALHWGRSCYSSRRSSNSRRRLEPRRVVTSEDADMFCLKKSLSMRNGQTIKFVDSSSTTDDERESVTPRASRRSMGGTIKPLVWRSRSVHAHEESD